VYCTKNGDRNTWNSELSYDTVAIEWTRGASWGGAVALTQNGKPWQQQLAIANGFTLIGAMHELGHILGEKTTPTFNTSMNTHADQNNRHGS
jgi:hypothetical protein